MSFCSDATVRKSVCVFLSALQYILFLYQQSFARNFRLQFSVGVVNPQFWGRGGLRGSGWYRLKERWAVHSNFSFISTRFRDIAVLVLLHAIFPYPTSSIP